MQDFNTNPEYATYEITFTAITTEEAGLTAPMTEVYEALAWVKSLCPEVLSSKATYWRSSP